MSAQTGRRPLAAALLVLAATVALAVFGVRAMATRVVAAPGAPRGLALESQQAAKREAARPAAAPAPAVDLTTWEDTDGSGGSSGGNKPRPGR